jgi:hypothetical protein
MEAHTCGKDNGVVRRVYHSRSCVYLTGDALNSRASLEGAYITFIIISIMQKHINIESY